MLKGINPLLTGELLLHLDRLGHSDRLVIADAHFPAHRLNPTVLEVAAPAPLVVRAVRSVLELDNERAVTLMDSGGDWNDVQRELVTAAQVPDSEVLALDRFEFYQAAMTAGLVIRTAETRIYANLILSKGVTPVATSVG